MGNKLPKGITQRGSSFRVSIMVSGVRQTATCDTLVDAIQQAEAIRQGVGTGQVQKALPWTLQEAADSFLRERVQGRSTSQASIKARTSQIKQVVDFFEAGGSVGVDAITYPEVMNYSTHLRVNQKLSPNYINCLLITLKGILDHAWRSGRKLEAAPKLELMKAKGARIRYLTQDEERTCLGWLDHCGQDDMRDIFSILIDTGLRIGELCALTWQDVDFKVHKIHVWMSKSAQPRAVVMTTRVMTILKRRKVAAKHPKVLDGMIYPQVNFMWQKLREGVGMMEDKDFVLHTLRHTCCTRLVVGGIDLRTVQKWMGHEDIKTTMRYAQFMPEQLFNAASVLEPAKPDLRVVEGD